MKRNKKIARKLAAIAAVSALTVSSLTTTAFAYGEVDAGASTFSKDTDNSTAFQTWRENVWNAGQSADTGKIALTPGRTEKDLNFAWYSETKAVPAVRVWKKGADMSTAKVYSGTASDISAANWQGKTYAASNKVTIEGYFESNAEYCYQYTSDYKNGNTVWSASETYLSAAADKFSVILTGDPQIGASGSSDDKTATDSSAARDTYNWDITMKKALEIAPNAAFLLSAGDQINVNGTTEVNRKTRESEYAGYLYPSVFRSLPIAATIGNHDRDGIEYTQHFNNPNSDNGLGETEAGGDFYFSYGDVLFISLNTNNRNQQEHRVLMQKAADSHKDAKWTVVIFHSDIYGSGEPHADTDATANRVIFAPLMDEFDVDICLTGHDHTYSRSYQILDGNVVDYDISKNTVTDPEGTLYITTGSGSGSKYYNLLNYTPYYIAERTNACLPAFSTIDFTDTTLTLKTYDYTGAKYADDFTITKTAEEMNIEEVIKTAETQLASIDREKYTETSVKDLEAKLDTLKKLYAAFTTAEDAMIDEISAKYGTAEDRVSGYGSVKNSDDRDNKANRFKAGLSTLLDKTIYSQIKDGVELPAAEQKLSIISGTELAVAKGSVVNAISALKEIQTETDDKTGDTDDKTPSDNTSDDKVNDDTSSPKTGDNSNTVAAGGFAALLLAAGVSLVVTGRKRKEDCIEK